MKPARSTFARYLLFEIPGWIIAAVVLALLVHVGELHTRTAWILLALFVAKDFALYPVLRVGYQPSPADGSASLVGALGTARERLDPEGWVRVGAELWRAEVAREHAPVEAGAAVRVVAVRALTLHVEPA
jgi:membrane-bound ClpP family serine protease